MNTKNHQAEFLTIVKTLASLPATHPIYFLIGGLSVAGILAFLLLLLRAYFAEEARQIRALIGHGIIYRLFRVELLTLAGTLVAGWAYSYLTRPVILPLKVIPFIEGFSQFFQHEFYVWSAIAVSLKLPGLPDWEHADDVMILQIVIGLIAIATCTFGGLEILDWRTRKNTPYAAVRPPHLYIGGVPFPWLRWISHLLLIGTTRAGKSVVLRAIIHALRLLKIPVLVLDNSGDFLSKFYDPATDSILSYLDKRGVSISFFCNLNRPQEIERLAYDLVSDGKDGSSHYFNNKTRELFVVTCEKLWASGSLTNGRFCAAMSNEDVLKKMMTGSEWETIIRDAKSWGDVYSTFTSYFSVFQKLPPDAGLTKITLSKDGETWEILRQGFNLYECARRMARGSCEAVFAPVQDADTKIMGPFLSMVVSAFNSAVIDQGEDPNRRIVLVVDELGEMPAISSLQSALSKGGKYGLSMMLGLQNVSQLEKIYGPDSAQIILGNCSSQLILRLPDVESAEWAADAIGKRYKIVSGGRGGKKDDLRYKILPSEIQHLQNLTGILIYFGLGLIKRIRLKYVDYPEIRPRHIDSSASAWRPVSAPATQQSRPASCAAVIQDPTVMLGGFAEESGSAGDKKPEGAKKK